MTPSRRIAVHFLCLVSAIASAPITAQSPTTGTKPAVAPATVPALFLSDIHLDPYADPAKVAKLNAAPAANWAAILASPASATQQTDAAALQKACPVRGIDTPNVLWQSSLHAIHANAASAKFVTISGDLLAHQFDCKFKTLLPGANHAAYLAFTEKTIRYIVSGLRASLPGVPLYIAMGNNDSGCTDYELDATHDDFLARIAPIVADALPADLPASDRAGVLNGFAAIGSFSAPLAGVPHTRILVLDDLFLSAQYRTCGGKPDSAPTAAQLAWLEAQFAAARSRGEHVWVMGHIPPGVNLYATARKLGNTCATTTPQMFLANEDLADAIASYPDVVRLAIFGHTHSDEMRLLTPKALRTNAGVPLKIVASITPVNGNNPTFTLAAVDPSTATLVDYTVVMASNQTGIATTWSPEYTYSAAYGEPAFDGAALTGLIAKFQADPAAHSLASQIYLSGYSPHSGAGQMLQLVWPQYVCSMENDSAAAFAACACPAAK